MNVNKKQLPPEWAVQSALMITWPHEDTDWRYCLNEIQSTYVELADAVTRYEPLIIVAPCVEDVKKRLSVKLSAKQLERVTIHRCPTNDTWTRDHGFVSLTDSCGSTTLLDFCFNGWGNKFEARLDNAINRSLYLGGTVKGEYKDLNDFILEGGSIESDGHGTILTTSTCLLAPGRNRFMTRNEIELRLKTELHAERILWIDYGHLEGDDTDGHIDTLVRTAPDYTLLYIGCDDKSDTQYNDLARMEEQLKTLRAANGRAYRLLRLPVPRPIYDGEERLPATYANFTVINGAVIYPVYNQPDNDEKAREIISRAFPGRDMIAIDSRTVIKQHGSLHCCTMQLH